MRLSAHLLKRRQASATAAPTPVGRGENNPTFEWSPADDEYFLVMRAHPIALVARALLTLDYLRAGVEEEGGEPAWIGMGVTYAVARLVDAGEYNAAGELLRGLESLVPDNFRGCWPLARWHKGEGDIRPPTRGASR